jgi:hypothetical protein
VFVLLLMTVAAAVAAVASHFANSVGATCLEPLPCHLLVLEFPMKYLSNFLLGFLLVSPSWLLGSKAQPVPKVANFALSARAQVLMRRRCVGHDAGRVAVGLGRRLMMWRAEARYGRHWYAHGVESRCVVAMLIVLEQEL